MAKISVMQTLKRHFLPSCRRLHFSTQRFVLSQAYLCDEAWQQRFQNSILKDIKMAMYFVETDKKFASKKGVSGIDIDLFANSVTEDHQLDELEHLLYKFRRSRRAAEMLDSTIYAVIRVFLKLKQYDSLMRILNDCESYGVFPDMFSYNMLMSSFLNEKLHREAAQVAVLMMLQEDFSNQISCALGLHSCLTFLKECPVESLYDNIAEQEETTEEAKKDDDDDEVTLIRVPFLRNAWFDDHFDIKDPKHLIGKTFYLIGRELDNPLGRSFQLIGLSMYEKWDKALEKLQQFCESPDGAILSSAVDKMTNELSNIVDDESKTKARYTEKFQKCFESLSSQKKIIQKDLELATKENLDQALSSEKDDITIQKRLFREWEHTRTSLLEQQNKEIEKERRLKVIEEKKEYLYWKEKALFFFENEDKNLEEFKKIEQMVAEMKKDVKVEDTYVPPEIVRKPMERSTKYTKLARVKKL